MLFRALENLNIGIRKGDVFPGSRLRPQIRDLLIVRQKIAPVNAPPIAALSEFVEVAETLVAAGIQTPADLIEAEAVEGMTAEELAAWQCEAAAALNVPHTCACNRR